MNYNVTMEENSEISNHSFQDDEKYPQLLPANHERDNMVAYINEVNEKIENMLQRKRTLLKARYLDMLNALEKLQAQSRKYEKKVKKLRQSIDKDFEILRLKDNIEKLEVFLGKIKINFQDLKTKNSQKLSDCHERIAKIKGNKEIIKSVYHENLLVDLGIKRLYESANLLGIQLSPIDEFSINQDSSIHFLNPSQSASLLQNSLQATRPTQEEDNSVSIDNNQSILRLAKAKLEDTTLIVDQNEGLRLSIKKIKKENQRLKRKIIKSLTKNSQIKEIFISSIEFSLKSHLSKEAVIHKEGLRNTLFFPSIMQERIREGKIGSLKEMERKQLGEQSQTLEAKEIIYKQLQRAKEKSQFDNFSLPKLALSKERFHSLTLEQLMGLLSIDPEALSRLKCIFDESEFIRRKCSKVVNELKFMI